MNNLRLEKQSRQVYDIEYTSKTSVLLKGIGRRCEVCGKHLFGDPRKKTCGKKCRYKKGNDKHRDSKKMLGLHSFILLKKHDDDISPYRIMKIYLKKGVIEEIKITPEYKQLWNLLDKIQQFRKVTVGVLN